MPLEKALSKMLGSITPSTESEMVTLADALGRILAVDVASTLAVPPFNNSAMDGYALNAVDLAVSDTLTMVGKSFAGTPYQGQVKTGQCIRIMTGAQVPDDVDMVIMQEQTCAEDDQIRFNSSAKPGSNIRTLGEEISVGQVVLHQGTKISARHISLLATLGCANVKVIKKISVAIFSTGDELKPLGSVLQLGEIYDSNRFGLIAQLQRLNVDIIDLGVIVDDPVSIREAFERADRAADVVITSGGVSVGEADFTREIMEQFGEINFWKLAIKPGKPIAYGKFPNSIFFGLPGNPVSALVTFYQVAKPALQKLSGATEIKPLRMSATLSHAIKKSPGRLDFQRGFVSTDQQGKLIVSSTGHQGSGMMSSLCLANCFIVLEQERGAVAANETVIVELFDELFQ
ncbi:MAG: molybdopterin molybdotransferase MoeA [Gammaproteobacteria bacterium]|nr:molybdopterin molybdotransferase MoeA [Gammaproteobacteria bacterium]